MQNEELIVSHRNYACAIAMSRRLLVRESELDDMISEAQLALLTAGRRFDGRGTFGGWIGRRVAGALDDWATSSKRRYGMPANGKRSRGAVYLSGNPCVRLTVRNAGVEYLTVQRSVLLGQALAALPALERDVIRRRFFDGDNGPEIAKALKIGRSWVTQLQRRGLRLLREELALRGVRKLGDAL